MNKIMLADLPAGGLAILVTETKAIKVNVGLLAEIEFIIIVHFMTTFLNLAIW